MKCPICLNTTTGNHVDRTHMTKSGRECKVRKGHCDYCGKDVEKHYYSDYHKKVKGPDE